MTDTTRSSNEAAGKQAPDSDAVSVPTVGDPYRASPAVISDGGNDQPWDTSPVPLSFARIWERSGQVFKRAFGIGFALMLLPEIFEAVAEWAPVLIGLESFEGGFNLLSLAVSVITLVIWAMVEAACCFVFYQAASQKRSKIGLGEALHVGRSHTGSVFVYNLALGLITGGSVFFFAVGFYSLAAGIGLGIAALAGLVVVASLWAVVIPLVVINGETLKKAFANSVKLVKNRFGTVVLVVGVTWAVTYGLSLLVSMSPQLLEWGHGSAPAGLEIVADVVSRPVIALAAAMRMAVTVVLFRSLLTARSPDSALSSTENPG